MTVEPRAGAIARWAIIILVGGYLLLPLVAMAEFSTRGDFGTRIARRLRGDPRGPEPDRRDHHDRSRSPR